MLFVSYDSFFYDMTLVPDTFYDTFYYIHNTDKFFHTS